MAKSAKCFKGFNNVLNKTFTDRKNLNKFREVVYDTRNLDKKAVEQEKPYKSWPSYVLRGEKAKKDFYCTEAVFTAARAVSAFNI